MAALLVVLGGTPGSLRAQSGAETATEAPATAVARLHAELGEARQTHLHRVGWWGAANLLAGVALAASAGAGAPTRRGFGIQTAAWGAINLGIVTWAALATAPESATTLAEALAAEDRWSHILLVNLGLNVGYMAVGGALWVASTRGLDSGPAVRGHAAAVVLQGAGLLVLDGVAWLSSAQRLEALRGVVESVTLAPGPEAGSVSLMMRVPFS